MFLDENTDLDNAPASIMDSPTLARVGRAMQRQEGKNVFYCQTNNLSGHAIQKGLLWQQRDKIFARWKERYFILTRDYLHCFRKATNNGLDRISNMGPFIFKIRLVDIDKVTWINKKTYSVIGLDFGRDGTILLRAQKGLEDWFDSLEECTLASKERRKALKYSRESCQGENELDMNSIRSCRDLGSMLESRTKIAQLQKDCISDSVPDMSTLSSLRKSIDPEKRPGDEDPWSNGSLNVANQRLSLLTDIDINVLDVSTTSQGETGATPTPCRLNSDVFFLPRLCGTQGSSNTDAEIQASSGSQPEYIRPKLEREALHFRPKNLLGSFRLPNMLQTTRGTANRYSLNELELSTKVIYSTYEKKPISS